MDSFFGNWYDQPDPYRFTNTYVPRTAASRPVQRQPEAPSRPVQRQPEAPRKVIRVPIFDASEPPVVHRPPVMHKPPVIDKYGTVLRIQKAVRGFLARKSLKRIGDVKRQVDAIEEQLSRSEVVDLIRRVERERLRMGESLMSLLLKLDSIRCFDLGVRDCRKAVIKKSIALQERIDAIMVADSMEVSSNAEEAECTGGEEEEQADVEVFGDDCANRLNDEENMEDNCGEEDGEEASESVVDVGVVSEVKVGETDAAEVEKQADVVMENDDSDNWVEVEDVENEQMEQMRQKVEDGDRTNNEMMEKMMKDNETMMCMMTKLFESNEKQMKMLTALANRVEMLEKAFVCDKQRRKTKQQKRTDRTDDRSS